VTFNWYPNAGGGGINIFRGGDRWFGLDWHRFKQGGVWMNRPHYHRGGAIPKCDTLRKNQEICLSGRRADVRGHGGVPL